MTQAIAPARHSRQFLRVFGWYACRLLRKRFASVRIADDTDEVLRSVADSDQPVIVAMNHPSWWDPIIGVTIKHIFMRQRFAISPIDMAMYKRFGFMKRLGLFGIDPDHPETSSAMLDYIHSCASTHPDFALFITPKASSVIPEHPLSFAPASRRLLSRLRTLRCCRSQSNSLSGTISVPNFCSEPSDAKGLSCTPRPPGYAPSATACSTTPIAWPRSPSLAMPNDSSRC